MERGDWIYTPTPKTLLPLEPCFVDCNILNRGNTHIITDGNCIEFMDKVQSTEDVAHLHLHGYFQKSWFYNQYRNEIKKMFVLPAIYKNTDDIVVHLRLTDYFWHRVNSVISPEWYINIVKGQQYKKCYIVVEDHPTNKRYLEFLTHSIKNTEVVTGGSALDDFNFIRSFDRIVCSNSTFCWWAAFLSEASQVWTFDPWLFRNSIPDLSAMDNAKIVPGRFYHDRELAAIDWGEYWYK